MNKMRDNILQAFQKTEVQQQNLKLLTHSHTCLVEQNRIGSHMTLQAKIAAIPQFLEKKPEQVVVSMTEDPRDDINKTTIEGWNSKVNPK